MKLKLNEVQMLKPTSQSMQDGLAVMNYWGPIIKNYKVKNDRKKRKANKTNGNIPMTWVLRGQQPVATEQGNKM